MESTQYSLIINRAERERFFVKYGNLIFTEMKSVLLRKKLIFIILFFSYCISQAQSVGNLFGTKVYYPGQASFVETNPLNGQFSIVSNLSPNIRACSERFLDAQNDRYFLVTADSINMYLMNYQISTGQLNNILFTVDSVGDGQSGWATIGPDISSPFYNCVDGQLYFYRVKKSNPNIAYLMKVDPTTSVVTQIHVFPYSNFVRRQYMDLQNQKIYLLSYTYPTTLLTYDLANGTSSKVTLSQGWGNNFDADIIFNPVDGNLYGIQVNYTNISSQDLFDIRVIRINPETGTVTFLSDNIRTSFFRMMALNETGNNLFFYGLTTDPGYVFLFNYDLKQRSYNTIQSDSISTSWFAGLDYYFNTTIDTSFSVSNFCQHAPTEFFVSNAESYITWDFGDPFSSSSNYSIGAQAYHTYNLPGIYTVTMVSSACDGIDTVKKQITIEAFPEINIGLDSVICSNYPIEPIIFNADAPSSTFLWQDGSTSSSYSTTVPELITVAINSSCGTVRDTAEVSGITCPCGIDLNPDITGNKFSFDIKCFLSDYGEIEFEIFDIVGRKIIDQKIVLNENKINVSHISAGAYIYRFRTGKEIYKTGKIIIVH